MSLNKTHDAEFLKYVHGTVVDTCYSPDSITMLHRYNRVPVFVYGTEKKGFSDEHVLEPYSRAGIGFTYDSTYRMKIHFEGYPLVFANGGTTFETGRIFGEIYIVPPRVLFGLDAMFQNGLFSDRRPVVLKYYGPGDKRTDLTKTSAWMYINRPERFVNTAFKNIIKQTPAGGTPYYQFRPEHDINKKKNKHETLRNM